MYDDNPFHSVRALWACTPPNTLALGVLDVEGILASNTLPPHTPPRDGKSVSHDASSCSGASSLDGAFPLNGASSYDASSCDEDDEVLCDHNAHNHHNSLHHHSILRHNHILAH